MKTKLFTLIAFVASCLFFSCSQQHLSFQKRHYRNGYYVDYTGKANDKIKNNTTAHNTITKEEIEEPKTVVASIVPQQNLAKENVIQPLSMSKIEKKDVASSTSPAIPSYAKKDKTSKLSAANTMVKKKVETLSKRTTTEKKIDDEGLSLFWIVIMVLLLLWFIALLGGGWGLGVLVNLLLVIALILLIFWLLQII